MKADEEIKGEGNVAVLVRVASTWGEM